MKKIGTILVVALFTACGSSSNEGDTGSNPNDLGDTSVTPVDGVTIDTPNGTDIPIVKECETNADCEAKGEGLACNCEFKCIPADCKEDKNCGSEKYCDPCYKVCMPLLPACSLCTDHGQCAGQMSHCTSEFTLDGVNVSLPEKVCAPWCPLSTKVCAIEGAPVNSYSCASIGNDKDGVCIPLSLDCGKAGKKCDKDADCPDPSKQKCWLPQHVCGCKDALSCVFGEACHPITHQCVPGCTSDTECGSGMVCSAGLCSEACTKNGDMVIGCDDPSPMPGKEWDCDEDGHCFIPGMCFSPLDCKEKETYCDTATHECVPGCLIDYDCKESSKLCDITTNTCIDRPCTGAWECKCGQVCDPVEKTCVTAEGKYCEVCDPQQGEEACGDKDILCIEFQTEDGQSKGAFCMPPCNLADPENECPQGWQCQEVQDGQGGSMGKKCIRFCYHEIEGCAIGNPTNPETSPEVATISDP